MSVKSIQCHLNWQPPLHVLSYQWVQTEKKLLKTPFLWNSAFALPLLIAYLTGSYCVPSPLGDKSTNKSWADYGPPEEPLAAPTAWWPEVGEGPGGAVMLGLHQIRSLPPSCSWALCLCVWLFNGLWALGDHTPGPLSPLSPPSPLSPLCPFHLHPPGARHTAVHVPELSLSLLSNRLLNESSMNSFW